MSIERGSIIRLVLYTLVAMMFFIAAVVWAQIPAEKLVPMHFSADGSVEEWGSPAIVVLLLPCVAAVLLYFISIGQRPSERNNLDFRFGVAVLYVCFFAVLFLHVLLLQAALMSKPALAISAEITSNFAIVVVGFLFLVIPRNALIGLRFPWSLRSEVCWSRTHAVGGVVFVALGVISFLIEFSPLAYHLRGMIFVPAMMVGIAISALVSYMQCRVDS